VQVEEARELLIALEAHEEQRAEVLDPERHLHLAQEVVEPVDEARRALVELFLEFGSGFAQVKQRGARGGESDRMANERAREPGDIGLGDRIVPVLPHSAVERIHEARIAGDDADREPAADHLSVGGEVGLHTEPRLDPARVGPKARDHLVEDQRHSRFRCHAP
jgi:hypothetical protein